MSETKSAVYLNIGVASLVGVQVTPTASFDYYIFLAMTVVALMMFVGTLVEDYFNE